MDPTTYFPYIKFRSVEWVKRTALFQDEVWRIIPFGYDAEDPYEIREFTDAGFLRCRHPSEDEVGNAALRFKNAFESGKIDRVWVAQGGPAEIHMQKVSDRIREYLRDKGLEYPRQRDNWYAVPANAVSAYMAFLANEFARHNGGSITSDERRMLDLVSLVQAQDSEVRSNGERERILRATFPILELRNPADIPATTIIDFRAKYQSERDRFNVELDSLARELASIGDIELIPVFLGEKLGRMAAAVNDLEAAAKGLGISTVIKFCSAILSPLHGVNLEGVASASLRTGIDLFLSSVWQLKKQRQSPVAYLYQLRRHHAFGRDRHHG